MSKPHSLLILPGLHGTCDLMGELSGRIAQARPVIPIDYPADPLLDLDALADLVLGRAPDGPFAVLGESFSGPLAILLAAREPRICGLILASTFARFPLPRALTSITALLMGLPVPPGRAARLLAGRSASPELVGELTRLIAGLPKPVIRHRIRLALGADMRAALAVTICPLLCLAGRRDRLTGRRSLASITGARPDAEVLHLDAGHMLLETHAEESADAIAAFLDRVRAD